MIQKSKLRSLNSFVILLMVCLIGCFTFQGCEDSFENEEMINSFSYDNISLLTLNYSDLKSIKNDGFYWNSEEANMIAVRFLELDSVQGKYKLNMSYKESIELHIHNSDYERMINEIEVTNDSIKKWSENNNMTIELSNPKDYIKNTLQIESKYSVRLKSGQEQTPQPGERMVNVSSSGLFWGSAGIWLPNDAKIPLSVTCYSPFTLTPMFNIKVKTCGNEALKGGVGVNGTWKTEITPHCSNTTCTFYFNTTSTNGGTATFKY